MLLLFRPFVIHCLIPCGIYKRFSCFLCFRKRKTEKKKRKVSILILWGFSFWFFSFVVFLESFNVSFSHSVSQSVSQCFLWKTWWWSLYNEILKIKNNRKLASQKHNLLLLSLMIAAAADWLHDESLSFLCFVLLAWDVVECFFSGFLFHCFLFFKPKNQNE